MMTPDEHERIKILSEKAINHTASVDDLKEFNELLDDWSDCVESNLMRDIAN